MSSSYLVLLVILALVLSGCGGVAPIPPLETENVSTITPQETQTPVIEPTAIEGLSENAESVYDIAVSRDKQHVAVFTSAGIYLYNSTTLMQQQFTEVESSIPPQNFHFLPSVTFSPDGNELIFSNTNAIWSRDLTNPSENDYLFLSRSDIPEWNISEIEYSPKGDRIMITTYGGYDKCDGIGINFALYDSEFDLLFDQYFCTTNAENYYRFTADNRVYIFHNARSMFFPFEFYDVDLVTGNVVRKAKYNPYSGNAEDFIYDVSSDGQWLAIGNYSNYEFTTKVVDAHSGNILQEVDGGIDFSLEGIGKLRKSTSSEVVSEKCGIINKSSGRNQYAVLTSTDTKAVLTISDWNPFGDWRRKALELWDLSTCKIEKIIP